MLCVFAELRMAAVKTIGRRRRAHRPAAEPPASPERQNIRVLHSAHGQGGCREARASRGLVLGHKRQNPSGKSRDLYTCYTPSRREYHVIRARRGRSGVMDSSHVR